MVAMCTATMRGVCGEKGQTLPEPDGTALAAAGFLLAASFLGFAAAMALGLAVKTPLPVVLTLVKPTAASNSLSRASAAGTSRLICSIKCQVRWRGEALAVHVRGLDYKCCSHDALAYRAHAGQPDLALRLPHLCLSCKL